MMKQTRTIWAAMAALSLLCMALLPAVSFANELPTAKELIGRYIEAMGGEAKLKSVQSSHARGTMEMAAMGMSADMEIMAAAPNMFLMKMSMPGVGDIATGFDGEIAWVDNPMTGPMLLEGDQLKEMVKQADFYSDLNYDKLYPTQETLEKVEFAGQHAYKVKLLDDDGKETLQYFAVENGYLIGTEGEQTNEMGTIMVTTELHDYSNVEGHLVPMKMVQKMMGMESVITMTEISFDSVEASAFELPDSIKTLAGKN